MEKKKLNLRDLDKKNKNPHKGHVHPHEEEEHTNLKAYIPAILSFIVLMLGITFDYFKVEVFNRNWIRLVWYGIAYIPVGLPVIKDGWSNIKNGDFFTEFFLMSIATLGAFVIGVYPEGVAVMLFYAVGELFQSAAVKKAKGSIKALLDVRPKEAYVLKGGTYKSVAPETVEIGEKIQIRVGEKIPLDGRLLTEKAVVNTAAISGESKPKLVEKNEEIYAGSINLENVIEVEVSKVFKDSSIARILELVQNATARKSKTELFIRKFARVYTPIVVYLAIGLTLIPYFFVENYVFKDWLYRALIFLVISCPCALVISIPLGYFGGLGAASKNGILFKGASFLDTMSKINILVVDKTGTLTKGIFKIKEIKANAISEQELMSYLLALEQQSTHPIATALLKYPSKKNYKATDVIEIGGKGLKGIVNKKTILAGNRALLTANNINIPNKTASIVESVVMIAIENKFAGYVIIADELKVDVKETIAQLYKIGLSNIIMLSGDKDSITQRVATVLGIKKAKGGLLPEEKLFEVEQLLKQNKNNNVAFVGDGINDAPVLAACSVGIAMGGLGSDVAIETADVIIQTDQPSKIVTAIRISRSTKAIVWQNITLAFGVKIIVMILGAGGLATMWEAVFADVGVSLLAILNAVRLQRMRWN